jgi:hypothetical protein
MREELKPVAVRVKRAFDLHDVVGDITFHLHEGFTCDMRDRDLLVELLTTGKVEPADAMSRRRVKRLSMEPARRSCKAAVFVVVAEDVARQVIAGGEEAIHEVHPC